VDRRANKIEVAAAVEKLFKVKVLDVHVMNILGKKKRVGRVMGEKRSWKKAIVTLAPGNHIEINEGV
jgi:large subunit ribosomal protein L23